MTISNKISYGISFSLLLILVISGCTLDNVGNSTDETITEEDLQASSQILGESLSSDNSGVILSLNDALTTISSSGFTQKTAGPTTAQDDDRSGRGNETNYKYTYDPETGTHTISFERQVQRALFSKTVIDTLNYIFRDNNESFIKLPRQQKERIETIDYNGRREGEISTPRKESFFVRKDTFAITGVSDASTVLTIDGVHNGQGSIEIDRPENELMKRSYQLEINFLNIEIDKAVVENNQNLQSGVTGTLSWDMMIEKSVGNRTETHTLRGTIELSGDGTALLRFRNYLKLFQINLNNGDVKDQDEEFEGRVHLVNLDENSLTLVNGRTVYVTDNTEFEDDDYPSLRAVAEALNNNANIWAEGEGFIRDGKFIVSEIEFENEEDDEDGNGDDDDDNDNGDNGDDEDEN